jgi:hypothetical protein
LFTLVDNVRVIELLVPGDTDGDGIGGEAPDDINPIRENFRKAVSLRSQGDLIQDGIVDFKDFGEWKVAYMSTGSSLDDVDLRFLTSVPEPRTLVMLFVAAPLLTSCARRRGHRRSRG